MKMFVTCVSAIVGLLTVAGAASANLVRSTTDSFDVIQGGQIITTPASSATIAGFNSVAIIGGANGGGEGGNGGVNDDTIFQNYGLNTVIFSRTATTPVYGVNLFNSSDGLADGNDHSTNFFNLFAGTIENGSFVASATLVSQSVNINDGSGTQFLFLTPTTATVFEAQFNSGGPDDGNSGPRIIELDAIDVPEPACAGLVGVLAIGWVVRRRRA